MQLTFKIKYINYIQSYTVFAPNNVIQTCKILISNPNNIIIVKIIRYNNTNKKYQNKLFYQQI